MVRNTRKCKPFDTQLHRHVRHSQANLARVFASLQRERFNSFRTGSRGRQNRISRPHRARQIPASSRAVGMGSRKTKLQQPAAFNLQIETPTSTKTKEKLQMTEPITPVPHHDGRYYANINGIAKGSIGCYFDAAGNLVATTLDNFIGSKHQQLTEKLHAEILRRGVVIPQVNG